MRRFSSTVRFDGLEGGGFADAVAAHEADEAIGRDLEGELAEDAGAADGNVEV